MLEFKSSTSVQRFIRSPSCQICLEPYDGSQHLPKILQCAHTVCESCIDALEEQGRQNVGMRYSNPGCVNISCPMCRNVTRTPRNYIRTNYELISVVEGIHGKLNLNIIFVTCIECNGVYHEKDVNVCNECSPIKENTTTSEIISQAIILSRHALCSTCLLENHILLGHKFVVLQKVRVEMQREENLKLINSMEDDLKGMQNSLRDKLSETINKWMNWSSNHDDDKMRFLAATDSYNQKKLYEESVKQLTKKTDRIDNLMKSVQRWSEELETEAPTVVVNPNPNPNPPVPPERPPRVSTPNEPPLGADFLYYFE